SSQIVSKLESQGIPFELRGGGAQIYVPNDRALRLRMSFAEQGVPRGGSMGYELFDRSDAIGATNFMQNLNLVRALEGELSRTISALSAISSARVHLVMPRRDLFNRERQEPTASVVLKMRDVGRLPNAQVQAIQHLVAAAIPGLKPGRVSVIDDRGTLLARGKGDGDEAGAAGGPVDDLRRSYEQRVARMIEDLIERSVGPGRVRAEVTADMDFDRIVTNTESFDPEGQVVRSTQTVTETSDSSEANGSTQVSVAGNLPEVDAAGANKNAARSNRSEETVNYEITRTTRNHVRESGVVRRLSVAVLVDGTMTTAADGTRSYAPRSPEEVARFTALIKSAIGFSEKRGDTLELANLPFAPIEVAETAPAETSMLGMSKQDYFRLAEILVLAIVAVLVILLVARPIVSHVFSVSAAAARQAAAGPVGGQAMLPDRSGGQPAALAPPSRSGGAQAEGPSEVEQMIDIAQVEGRVKASSMKKIGEIVDKHPEEAVSIMRTWMYQET
ncbi:MAG: flagellar M-ring protein FliF, partial [Rhodospirillales bacterium]|nr:flagellar M-ring protein FliF [Rhodospirillales bacterium]